MTRLRIAGPATVYAVAQVLTALPAFVMIPVMTRHLSTVDYGLVALFSVSATLLNPLIGLGIGRLAPVWRLQLLPAELSRRLAAGITAVLLSAGLFAGGLLLLRLATTEVLDIPVLVFVLAALSQAPQALLAAQLGLWQAERRSIRFGVLQVFVALVNVAVSIVLVVEFGLGWEGRVSGHVVAMCAGGAVATIGLWAAMGGGTVPRPREVGRTLRSAMLPLLPYGIGTAILAVSDRLIAASLLEIGEVGVYVAAYQLTLPVLLLGEVCNRALAPSLIAQLERREPGAYRASWRTVAAAAGTIGLAAVALGAALAVLGDWLLGPGFRGALAILPYLLAANAAGAVAALLSTYLLAAGRPALLSWAMAAAMLCVAIACVLSLPHLTAVRLAQCFAAVNVLLLVLLVGLIRRTYASAAQTVPTA